MASPPPQSYAKHLLPLGYGYPLWTPEPSHELLLRRRDGLRIGDVGVIDLENGSFDVFFNICLPREHPLHRVTGVPDNFVPIELNEWDIASFPHAEYPGRVISTSSVTATTIEPSGEATSRCVVSPLRRMGVRAHQTDHTLRTAPSPTSSVSLPAKVHYSSFQKAPKATSSARDRCSKISQFEMQPTGTISRSNTLVASSPTTHSI